MKKITSIILSLFLVLSFSGSVLADQPNNQPTNTKNISTEEKIKDMLSDGLSLEDATYYAKVDDIVKKMESDGTKITLDESIPNLSDQEVTKDIKSFREKVLNGDKAAIKKTLESPIYTQGVNDINKLIKQNNGQSEYKIKYSDGSVISVKFHQGDIQNNKVKPNEYIWWTSHNTSSGYYTGAYAEWQYTSGSNYAKTRITINYTLTLSTAYANIDYAHGVQASYGIVSISNSNAGVITRATNNNGLGLPAEANNSVVFSVSGSFSANFGPLSVSVNQNQSWTQDAYYRVWGDGWLYAVADSYY